MVVGTTTRPNLFVVIPTKVNYNLLLRREWIHVIGTDEIVEHIEEDQSFFHAEVNHIHRRNFNPKLTNILQCTATGTSYDFKGDDVYYSIMLDFMHGFMWRIR